MRAYLVALSFGIALSPDALAHGPAIQFTVDAGKITSRQVLIDHYSPLTAPTSVYVAPLNLISDLDFNGGVPTWRATPDANPANPFGPGIAYGEGGTFPASSTLTLTFLEELMVWDGSAFVSAGSTELAVLRTSNPGATSLAGNAGFSGGADASVEATIGATYNADSHSQTTYVVMEGASPAAGVLDGLYRAKLQLASSDPLVAPSDPFYLVLAKGSHAALGAAVSSLGFAPAAVQYLAVPEPSALVVAVLGLVAAASRRVRG